MKQVTEIRCSGLSRPMKCAGFLAFENLPDQETNEAAKEGTACGEYLAAMLTGPTTHEGFPGMTHASNGVEIDADMKFYCKEFADMILQGDIKLPILCEQRIDWQTRSGIWIRGSYDISYVKDRKLYIDDLKYGWGIVDVFENWQLLGYAIGEVIRRQQMFDRIVLRIHQPRPHHEDGPTREWELTYDQLSDYKEQIEARMDQIAGGFRELCTGKQCKYCPATASHCPAFNRAVFSGIDHVLSEFKQDSINEKEIAHQLTLLDRVAEILKIKQGSLKDLAVSKIKNGAIIPGYMCEASYGDRKWKKGISPLVIETLTGKKIVEEVMLSPAKAEKLGVPKELITMYVDRHFIGQKLVQKDANKLGDQIFGKGGTNGT